jgi:hypothetical protein
MSIAMTLTVSERKARLGYGAAAKIARQTRRTHGHVWQVLDGTRYDAVVVRVAARRVGMPPEELFPEYADQIIADREAEAASQAPTPD